MKKTNVWKMSLACAVIVLSVAGTALAGGYGQMSHETAPITAPAPASYTPPSVGAASTQPNGGDSSPSHQGTCDSQAQSFDIRGTITELYRKSAVSGGKPSGDPNQSVSFTHSEQAENGSNSGGPVTGFLIQGDVSIKTPYDKASVRLTEATKIYKKQDGQLIPASLDNIYAGTYAEVYFTGPVAESYPVQATAGKIVIVP